MLCGGPEPVTRTRFVTRKGTGVQVYPDSKRTRNPNAGKPSTHHQEVIVRLWTSVSLRLHLESRLRAILNQRTQGKDLLIPSRYLCVPNVLVFADISLDHGRVGTPIYLWTYLALPAREFRKLNHSRYSPYRVVNVPTSSPQRVGDIKLLGTTSPPPLSVIV